MRGFMGASPEMGLSVTRDVQERFWRCVEALPPHDTSGRDTCNLLTMIMMLANIVIFRILCCFNHIAYSTQAQGRREKNCHFRIAAVLSDIEAESNRGTTQQSAAPSILTEKTSYFLAEVTHPFSAASENELDLEKRDCVVLILFLHRLTTL
ncbi:hypothetical protein F2Q70_00029434 [Brassica cretica]|uniref:Uncharacterized protein n=1 Tax=Brassica cretica TaxID=69181 RepID=A0A8S9FDG7_BRACR|nr:hypothetical protein F2Q70_00029434 [Brassica cretica]